MKKALVIGVILLCLGISFAPCINANVNSKKNILNDDNENFNCLIVGKTSATTFIIKGKPGYEDTIIKINIIPILIFYNVTIALGWKYREVIDLDGKYESSGRVWTKGSNGVKTWESNSLWGNLGKKEISEWMPWGGIKTYWYYKAVIGFTGIRIGGINSVIFFGIASHVSIVTEFPG